MGVLLVSRNLAYLSRMQSTLAYSRKLVALGRLTAGIAHEVKNPLNAMMIHLELLRTKLRAMAKAMARQPEAVAAIQVAPLPAHTVRRPEPSDPAMAQGAIEHVEVIESEIRRLDEVVQGFLKFTRPEDLRLQPVQPLALIEEILPVIEPEAQRTGVTVHVECPPSVPAVNGDAGMLRQAFLNKTGKENTGIPEPRNQRVSGNAQRRNAPARRRARVTRACRDPRGGHRRRHPAGKPAEDL